MVKPPPAEPDESSQRVLRSPALYLGEVVLPPDQAGDARLLSGRRLKNLTFPLLHTLARRAPRWLAMAPFRLAAVLMQMAYGWRANPLRQAVEDFAVVAGHRGRQVNTHALYGDFLRNAKSIVEGYLELEREGVEAAVRRVEVRAPEAERVLALLAQHEGAIMAVGHNFGAVYSAARLMREFPALIISKNSSTAQRTRMAIEIFERMQAKVIMVRGGNPVALSRAMFRALRERMLLAATVENVARGEGRVEVEMFGTRVGVSPWAATIAAKRHVPVIPFWFASVPGGVQVQIGEAIVNDDPIAIVDHYMEFFEARILEDPASWAYLADKHWRRVLRQAAQAIRGDCAPQQQS